MKGFERKRPQYASSADECRERLEQIRQVEGEIQTLDIAIAYFQDEFKRGSNTVPEIEAMFRCKAREHIVLAELKWGMKDQGRV